MRFLSAAEGQPRFFWANDREPVAIAGVGGAVELMAWGPDRFATIENDARALYADAHIADDGSPTGPRLFGGFSFRADFTPDNTWSIYAPAHFSLPHYQLTRIGDQSWLRINAQIPRDESPADLMPDLYAALRQKIAQLKATPEPALARTNRLLDIRYPMSDAMWREMVDAATRRFQAGRLNKVVLARAAELRFEGRVQLLPVLRRLAADYGDCYRFLFEPRSGYAFYGATPELLVGLRGRRVNTMALAGSIGRGANARDDLRLGQALLRSDKDRREHQIVLDRLRARLLPLCDSLETPSRQLLRLKTIQHIHTPIQGELKRPLSALALAKILHPTPALGGDPRDLALDLIRQLEPIPRGWYGAPVGWLDAALDGQFAVAIRSAVAQESRAWIYAGAGIVAGSEADKEWRETALKFQAMLDAHGE